MTDLLPEEVAQWKEVSANFVKPTGKPTPEEQAKLKIYKVESKKILGAVAKRLSITAKAAQKMLEAAMLDMVEDSGPPAELCQPSGTRDFFPEDMCALHALRPEGRREGGPSRPLTTHTQTILAI